MLNALPDYVRGVFRKRVSGDPTGAPDWVRDIATVGTDEGWFDPDGIVWKVHGDLSTLAGGIVALTQQAAHPLALAGVQRHSTYREDPRARLSGTARWLVLSTFGSTELAERESARVRGMHKRVKGLDDHGRPYAASSPDLLRWVHLAFTDAFLAGQKAAGADLRPRFGPRWPDAYVAEWAVSAEHLGATDLPYDEAGLAEALASYDDILEPVPDELRTFLSSPPGLSAPERLFYLGLSRMAALLVSPTVAPYAGVPGRDARNPLQLAQLQAGRAQLRGLGIALGRRSPSEEAARFRVGLGPEPAFLSSPAAAPDAVAAS